MTKIQTDNDVSFESNPLKKNGEEIYIVSPEPQDAITQLPVDFKITTIRDIRILQEFLSHKYNGTGFEILFRGHESDKYKLKSTLCRAVKDKDNEGIAAVEKKALELFDKEVYNKTWTEFNIPGTDIDLFKLSIARHLGMSCRLIDVSASMETAVFFSVCDPRHYHENGELVVIVIDKEKFTKPESTSFTGEVYYRHAAFIGDMFFSLPLGESRRLHQNGQFIFVGDKFLTKEEETIKKNATELIKIPIPSYAKISLAQALRKDVYSGYAYESEIQKINNEILK